MKKFILSIFVILSFGFYVISQNTGNSSNNLLSLSSTNSSDTNTGNNIIPINIVPTSSNTNNPYNNSQSNTNQQVNITTTFAPETSSTSKNNPTPIKTVTPTTVSAPIVKKIGLYNDGTYTGDPAFAYNDNVQVKVIISSGKIADIQFIQYPTRGRSGSISSFSLPTLKQEAIQAQSANIDAVSGASYTSPAFVQSLTSALDQAKV